MSDIRCMSFVYMPELNKKALTIDFGSLWQPRGYVDGPIPEDWKFFKHFLRRASSEEFVNDYFMFIIADHQLQLWQELVHKYNIDRFIVHKSSELAKNKNHADKIGRLGVYILKFDKDFKVE